MPMYQIYNIQHTNIWHTKKLVRDIWIWVFMNRVSIYRKVIGFRKPIYSLLHVDSLINAYFWTLLNCHLCRMWQCCQHLKQKEKSKRAEEAVDKAGNMSWVELCETYGRWHLGGSISLLSEAVLLKSGSPWLHSWFAIY